MAYYKPFATVLEESLTNLETLTGVSATAPESIARALIELPLLQVDEVWNEISTRDDQLRLATASGDGLDVLGQLFGVSRMSYTTAVSAGQGLKFYLNAAVGTPTIIPAGTYVWPPEDASRYFLTTTTVTIPAGGTEGLTGIRAPYTGAYYVAMPGELTAHNASATVLCTNLESLSGSETEDDDAYRYRISQALSARNVTLPNAIKAKLLEFPGVLDATLMPLRRGTGTLDVFVYTTAPIPSQQTLNDIKTYLDTLVAYGITTRVYGPTIKTVNVTIATSFTSDVSTADKASYRQQAALAIQQYINLLPLGAPLSMDRLTYLALATTPTLQNAEVTRLAVNDASRQPDTLYANTHERWIAGTIEVV